MNLKDNFSNKNITLLTFGYVIFLYIAWILAWFFHQALLPHWNFLNTHCGNAIFWIIMKVIVWILPALWVLKLSSRHPREFMSIKKVKTSLYWGIGAGLFLALVSLLTKLYLHKTLFISELSWFLLTGVIVAPIIEEFVFRDLVLGNFLAKYKFFWANTLTAFLFMLIHFPGWYFQGKLMPLLTSLTGGALSVFWIGWLFGYIYYRTKSASSSMITHAINNLFSAV